MWRFFMCACQRNQSVETVRLVRARTRNRTRSGRPADKPRRTYLNWKNWCTKFVCAVYVYVAL